MQRIFVIAIALAAPMAPAARAAETPAPAQATDAHARVPQSKYDSAFSGYQPYREQKPAPWRELNDDVHKAGGHLGIFGGTPGKPPAQHPPGHTK